MAQLISIFTMPFLTRIYTPVSYDVLGLYMMVTGVLSTLATLQFHNAIITGRDDAEAATAASMCIYIAVAVALLTAVLTWILFPFISTWLNNDAIRYWLFLAPLSVFFSGWNAVFSAWSNRTKTFKLLSLNRVLASVLVPVFSISLGLIIAGPAGLITGLLISQVLPAILLSRYFFKRKAIRIHFSMPDFKILWKKYNSFARFSLPSELINNVINQLPIIMLASFYAVEGAVGNFNLSNRMLGMPIQLIAASMLEVFRQRASAEFHEKGNCNSSFIQTFKLLFLGGILPFTCLMILGPWIFKTVFGHKWEMAGEFSRIMAPFFFLKFVVSPLSYVFFIVGKQKEDFIGHIAMVVLVLLAFVLSNLLGLNFYYALIFYSISYCLIYLYYLIRSYQLSKG